MKVARSIVLVSLLTACAVDGEPAAVLPATLRATGIASAGVMPFTPQYPLWTDGARKQRWIYLPPGTAIDAREPERWQFPVGTKLWKEFAFERRAETRYMERTRDGWRFATYVWTADGSDAVIAPAGGPTSATLSNGAAHVAPGEKDCVLCHRGDQPVLGFSALQLSPDRDPGAPHREDAAPGAIDLTTLVASGLLAGYTGDLAPRIAGDPVERAALGYLHGNCGSCHRDGGAAASLGMVLAHPGDVHGTTIAAPSRFTTADATLRIVPGAPAASVLVARVTSRVPATQMPPLGTQLVDHDAVALLTRWITQLPSTQGDDR